MENLLHKLHILREKCIKYHNNSIEIFDILEHRPPVSAFNMIFNDLTMLLEITNNYYNIWQNNSITNNTTIEEAQKQNGQRINNINRMTFITILSTIEFCSTNYCHSNPFPIGTHSSLFNVLEKSKREGIITNDDWELWQGILSLRNAIVHNNAIVNRLNHNGKEINKKIYVFPDCELVLEKNKMTRGDLKFFLYLIGWILDTYKNWCDKILPRKLSPVK